LGPPNTFINSIHVVDGGRAVAAALKAPAGVYNVVDDDPLAKRDFADALAAGRGRYLRAPGRLALLLGDSTTSLTRSLRVSNARFKAATGWSPEYPSAREGWRAI
jgi:nucleoside-diphosphate-sugar epimerase